MSRLHLVIAAGALAVAVVIWLGISALTAPQSGGPLQLTSRASGSQMLLTSQGGTIPPGGSLEINYLGTLFIGSHGCLGEPCTVSVPAGGLMEA